MEITDNLFPNRERGAVVAHQICVHDGGRKDVQYPPQKHQASCHFEERLGLLVNLFAANPKGNAYVEIHGYSTQTRYDVHNPHEPVVAGRIDFDRRANIKACSFTSRLAINGDGPSRTYLFLALLDMIVLAAFVAHTRIQIIVEGIHNLKFLAHRLVGFAGGGKVDEVEALDLVRNPLVSVRCDGIRKNSLALPAFCGKTKE